MGILTRKLGVYAMTLEDPAQPLMPPSALFESLGLGRSDAGVMVNERQALRLPVAYSCIKGISEDLASTAFEVIQELPDESMRTAKTHRLWPILHDEWNPQMASIVGRAAIISSALGWGNGYAWIKRDRAARVVGLYPLESGKTSPVKLKGELKYATTQTDTGVPIYLDPENVLHVMGLSNDGVVGLSPIQLAKNAFGLGIAAEKFGAQFFANGARATGVLSYPGALEEEAEENLKQSLREMATGENANAPVLLEEGMKWEQISINPTDSQFLETRKFQRADIAGMFRYPMHLLGSLERSTNNNIEHQGLDYVRYCLRPWAIRLEHEVNRKLLASPFTAEHNFNDLQRGDFASQTAGLQILRNIGVYSANKCLRVLRQNPISAAEGGDVLTVQGAMINLSTLVAGNEPPDEPVEPESVDTDSGQEGEPAARKQIVLAYKRLFRDAVGRVTNRETWDRTFVRRAFYATVASMAEAMLATRFGNPKLTPREKPWIEGALAWIEIAARNWNKNDAPAIADQLTGDVFDDLAKGILI